MEPSYDVVDGKGNTEMSTLYSFGFVQFFQYIVGNETVYDTFDIQHNVLLSIYHRIFALRYKVTEEMLLPSHCTIH